MAGCEVGNKRCRRTSSCTKHARTEFHSDPFIQSAQMYLFFFFFFFLNQFRPFAFPLKMEPYLTSGTNIYSESTNTERLNAVRDLLPAEAPTFAVFARCNLRRILFLFNCRQALFVNQKHTANLYFGKQKNLCVSFSPARLGSADGSRFAGGGEKKNEEEEVEGGGVGVGVTRRRVGIHCVDFVANQKALNTVSNKISATSKENATVFLFCRQTDCRAACVCVCARAHVCMCTRVQRLHVTVDSKLEILLSSGVSFYQEAAERTWTPSPPVRTQPKLEAFSVFLLLPTF